MVIIGLTSAADNHPRLISERPLRRQTAPERGKTRGKLSEKGLSGSIKRNALYSEGAKRP